MKVKERFWSCSFYLYTPFFGHSHVTFPHKEILSLFGFCHVTCPYMDPPSYFGKFVQEVILSCFSDSFDQKTTQQSDGNCNATSDSQLLRKVFKKQPFHFGKYIRKIHCEQRILHCPSPCQNVLFTRMQITHFFVG